MNSSFFQGQVQRPAASSLVETKNVPWVEKYRPQTVEDVSHQEETIKTLKSSLETGMLPHMLFYGPPGTGKTTTILAMARQLFGMDFRSTGRVLELNASDDRGIAVIRNKVKTFAQGAIGKSNTKMPPFKLIILDEADSMTNDAQSALRRMIENYSKVTRFCLICNYVSRIIEPIASRCAKFRFKPLEPTSMLHRLQVICQAEEISQSDDVLKLVLENAQGDMRKAINLLQTAQQLNGDSIAADQIVEIAGLAPKNILHVLWTAIKSNQGKNVIAAVDDLLINGYPASTLFQQLCTDLIESPDLNDVKKSKLSIKLAQADKHLLDGADEELQLLDVVMTVMVTFHTATPETSSMDTSA